MYTEEMKVAVFPFTRQEEGEEVVIGRLDTGVFLALPSDAVELLDLLATGDTVGRAQQTYREKYGETPDMNGLLVFLQSKGFVRPEQETKPMSDSIRSGTAAIADSPRKLRYHFSNVPQSVARALFGPKALMGAALLIALAAVAISQAPQIFPGRSALFFHHDKTLMTLCLVMMGYTTVFFHEMGHLLAARAQGVSSRLGIGRRMWVLVAETDMTGLWSVPRERRYLPVLAGPLVDVTSAAVMLIVLYAAHRQWIFLKTPVVELLQAMCFVYMMRVVWQCFFFVRTDFYFAIANFFGCKSLMQDTQVYIRNWYRRLTSSSKPLVDQGHLPASERRVIHAYAWIWLLGRIIALTSLFFITIPVAFRYLVASSRTMINGFSGNRYEFLDALFIFCFYLIPLAIGLSWWLASLLRQWRLHSEKRAYAT